MQGRTWKEINVGAAQQFKEFLRKMGALDLGTNSPYEAWRMKLADANFTYYHKGTLYSTPSISGDYKVQQAWEHLDQSQGSAYTAPTKKYLIGLDETGKGEVLGPLVLAGALLPQSILTELDRLIGPADTKNKHTFQYWEKLFQQIENFKDGGFSFVVEQIPPEDIDRYNLNRLLDTLYQKIIIQLQRDLKLSECRVVVDDYGLGTRLSGFLNLLESRGAEIIIATHSEDHFLETKVASLIAKRTRENVMHTLENTDAFRLPGASLGSGNSGDPKTREWLERWHATGKAWPWFVKKSFSTVRRLDGLPEKTTKIDPPIETDLLSSKFVKGFEAGQPVFQELRVSCPACGRSVQSLNWVIRQTGQTVLICPAVDCGQPIESAALNLKYYCGVLLPDCSAIQQGAISRDLHGSARLENFKILLAPMVRNECSESPQGMQELQRLRQWHESGRIQLAVVGRVAELPRNISKSSRDEQCIAECLANSAILVTANPALAAFAVAQNVFTICTE